MFFARRACGRAAMDASLGSRCAYRLSRQFRLPGDANHQRLHHRHVAVSRRRRADADLRRAQGREFQPRRLLYVRRLFRDDGLSVHRQLCAGDAVRRGRHGAARPDLRARVHEPGLWRRRADAVAGLLRLRADLRRRRADDLGAGIQVDGHAGGVPGGAAVHRRRRGAAVLSAADRRRAGGCRGPRARPGAHEDRQGDPGGRA